MIAAHITTSRTHGTQPAREARTFVIGHRAEGGRVRPRIMA
jgi:hypothetical protein